MISFLTDSHARNPIGGEPYVEALERLESLKLAIAAAEATGGVGVDMDSFAKSLPRVSRTERQAFAEQADAIADAAVAGLAAVTAVQAAGADRMTKGMDALAAQLRSGVDGLDGLLTL